MSQLRKTNNRKLRNTLCLSIQHRFDKNLESNDKYGWFVGLLQHYDNESSRTTN